MNVQEFSSINDLLEKYGDRYSCLIKEDLYLSPLWFDNFVNTGLEEGSRPRLFSLEEGNGIPQAILMARSPAAQNGSRFSSWNVSPRTLASLTNFQSSFYSLLLEQDRDDCSEKVEALVKGIVSVPEPWHMIDLNLLNPDEENFQRIKHAFKLQGFRTGSYFYKANWYERFDFESFDDYLKNRSKPAKKSQQNYLRKLRKLERENRLHVEMCDQTTDLETLLSQYDAIYAQSWKDKDHFPDFCHGLIRQAHRSGGLRMIFVWLDGHPVAFELAIVTGKQCVMVRTAYDPGYSRDSVGSIAILKMIEHVINVDRVCEIDFGTDDDPYKACWVKSRRERHGLVFFNSKTLVGNWYWIKFSTDRVVAGLSGLAKRLLDSITRFVKGN